MLVDKRKPLLFEIGAIIWLVIYYYTYYEILLLDPNLIIQQLMTRG